MVEFIKKIFAVILSAGAFAADYVLSKKFATVE